MSVLEIQSLTYGSVIALKCINRKEIVILNDKYELRKYRLNEKTKKLKYMEDLSLNEDLGKRFPKSELNNHSLILSDEGLYINN